MTQQGTEWIAVKERQKTKKSLMLRGRQEFKI